MFQNKFLDFQILENVDKRKNNYKLKNFNFLTFKYLNKLLQISKYLSNF